MILDKYSGVKTIVDLLTFRKIYKVPRYQRCFSWEREQIETFWEDLTAVIKERKKGKKEDYFFGSMIFKELSEEEVEIIDGQQRMAVITILFSCIRDLLSYSNTFWVDLGLAGVIDNRYITNYGPSNLPQTFKLILNQTDDSFFKYYIQEKREEKNFERKRNLHYSNRLILNAYNILRGKILEELNKINSDDDKRVFLNNIVEIVAFDFKILSTYVDSIEEAFVVFETLNDRGLDLSIADLLKNYFYSKAGKRLDKVQSLWEDMMEKLDNKDLNRFLRYYWLSSKGLVREKELYRVLKNELNTEEEVCRFVHNLKNEAEIYYDLINPDYNSWKDKNIVKLLIQLKNLNVKQVYPLLLSGYKIFEKSISNFKTLIEWSINLTFRYSIICGRNPNDLEKEYSNMARMIRNGKDLKYIKKHFLELNPDDEDFIKNFEKKEIKNQKIARYLLAKIVNTEREKKDTPINENDENITLEHIIPKKLTTEWIEYIKKYNLNHEELLYRIGNLTLLIFSRNKNISNKSFQEKCKEYKKSDLFITKDIYYKYKDWNEEAINARQKELAEIAKKIWKI